MVSNDTSFCTSAIIRLCVCVCVCLCVCVCVRVLSLVSFFLTSWTVATRLLCPWNFPGRNTGVGCHFLLQGIFPTQELNPHLLHLLRWQADALPTCAIRDSKQVISPHPQNEVLDEILSTVYKLIKGNVAEIMHEPRKG